MNGFLREWHEPRIELNSLVLTELEATILIELAERPADAISIIVAAFAKRHSHLNGHYDHTAVLQKVSDGMDSLFDLAAVVPDRSFGNHGLDLIRKRIRLLDLRESCAALVDHWKCDQVIHSPIEFQHDAFQKLKILTGFDVIYNPDLG